MSREFRAGSPWRLSLFALVALVALALLAPAAQAKQVVPKVGGEIPVNTTTFFSQTSPAVAADAHGNFVVTWIHRDEHFEQRVVARLFGADGAPRTPEIRVDTDPAVADPQLPRVAMDGAGRFVVVWLDQNVWLRRFDAQGAPLGAQQRADEGVGFLARGADVAMSPAGDFAAVWVSDNNAGAVYARRYDEAGAPREAPVRLDTAPFGVNEGPRVAASATGGYLLTWWREKSNNLIVYNDEAIARRTTGATAPWTPEIKANVGNVDIVRFALPVFHADGGFSVVWQHREAQPGEFVPKSLVARRFDAAGVAQGGEVTLPFDPLILESPAVATDPFGNTLVVVALDQRPQARLFDSAWHPVGGLFQISASPDAVLLMPAATPTGEGFTTVWANGSGPVFFPHSIAKDGSIFQGILAQILAPPLCAPGSKVLCLGEDGRFELTVDWRTPAGDSGPGRALPVFSGSGGSGVLDDTGSFWFFDASNVELVTKVLDGRAVNGSFWLFSGALSNLDYTLHVTDTASGARRDYHNALGQLASRADTSAFPDRGGNGGPPPPPVIGASGASEAIGGLCPDLQSALCFASGRLAVEVSFVDPRSGATTKAHPAGLTADTGTFWFFTRDNLELAVKVLDGGAVNDFFWVFSAGMSNLDYTVKVTDRTTGAIRTYHNAPGELASRADTRAIPH